ncbi:MAG: hypothetical protein ACD_21C00052G0015 [uncultured bacterium]|nr:MAG: hypothetical protein ACD_21C00052G0015 [uncultured bacterium]
MSPETKQRIVGAVVLIAFVVLLVPFLFTNGVRKKQSAADEMPITAEKRQQITQQIQDISNTATVPSSLPPPVSQSVAMPQSTVLQQNQFEQSGLLPPDDNQAELMVNAVTDSNQVDQSISTQNEFVATNTPEADLKATVDEPLAPIKPAVSMKSKSGSIAIKKPVAIKTAKSKNVKKVMKPNTKEFWSVQVGSFSDPVRVQKLTAELHRNGFRVYQQKVATPKALLTRILVGHEASKEKANEIAAKLLNTMKLKGHIVRNNIK